MRTFLIKIYDVKSDKKNKLIGTIPHKSNNKIDAQNFAEELVFNGEDGIGKMVFVEEIRENKQTKNEGEDGYQPSLF